MVCPQCGYDMGSAHRCIRCGYEVKTLAVRDEENSDDEKKNEEEEPSTVVIDPSNVYLSSEDDYYDEFDPFDPFGSLFGGMFDPIGDILGGLFGVDMRAVRREEQAQEPKKRDKKEHKVVEVRNVEILDENGNPVKSENAKKHPFKRGNHNKKR